MTSPNGTPVWAMPHGLVHPDQHDLPGRSAVAQVAR
jgi:hypothetical protein